MTPALEQPIAETRAWVNRAVIGLNLCPFAKAVHVKKQIRYAISAAQTSEDLLADLVSELHTLRAADPAEIDTTLLVHPRVLGDFLDYNDFLELAEAAVASEGLEGEIQVASFHPRYQFAGTRPEDIENCSNRSPYPTLHLLGTCRMGNDSKTSVVNADHRAHDVPNLFMVDGSSFVTNESQW